MKEVIGSLGATTAFALFAFCCGWVIFACGMRNDWCLIVGALLAFFLFEYGRSLTALKD